jgi:hypothetical protein
MANLMEREKSDYSLEENCISKCERAFSTGSENKYGKLQAKKGRLRLRNKSVRIPYYDNGELKPERKESSEQKIESQKELIHSKRENNDQFSTVEPSSLLDSKFISIKKIQNLPISQDFKHKVVDIGRRFALKTLVFDLDSTLVYENEEGVFVKRPYVKEILNQLALNFEIIVLTASIQERAEKIIRILDPKQKIFRAAFFRDSCVRVGDQIIKDLRIFQDRKISDLILIDDDLTNSAYQINNFYPIPPFTGEEDDFHLVVLSQYLRTIQHSKDLRNDNRTHFRLEEKLSKIKLF